MKTRDWIKEHNLGLDIMKGYQTGILLGTVSQFKGVTVQGHNEQQLYDEANIALTGYFNAFPEELEKLNNET